MQIIASLTKIFFILFKSHLTLLLIRLISLVLIFKTKDFFKIGTRMFLLKQLGLGLGGLLLAFVFYVLINYYRVRKYIMKLPGPKLHPLTGNIKTLISATDELFVILRKWGLEYYPIYRLYAPPAPAANIIGPDEMEIVLSSMKHSSKGLIYEMLVRWLGRGLLISQGVKWQTRRKILTPAFHFNILQGFIEVFNEETERLVNDLEKECDKTYTNVVPFISTFTLYTINETSMGIKLNFEHEEERNYIKAIFTQGEIYLHRLVRPWLYIPLIYWFSPTGIKELFNIRTLHNFTNKVIKQKSNIYKKLPEVSETGNNTDCYSKRKRLAMLDLLLHAKFEEGIIDDEGIREEVDTFMFEGHDTTSIAICFTLMLLACNKYVQEQIVQEIYQVLGDSDRKPTYADLQELKYMERAIKECMRLYPSVPLISRILDEDIQTPSGYFLAKWTIVILHIFDLHRNPNIYPEPNKFDPDRFLPENIKGRHPFAYLPFSAGPRNCIGQKFALLEIKAVLCGILRRFVLQPVDTPETTVCVCNVILKPKDQVKVKFVRREKIKN